MSRAVRTATAVALILMPGAALAQPNPPAPEPAALRGESAQTRKRLAEVEQKLLAGKAADAADELQRILDESGDDLVSLDGEQFRAARQRPFQHWLRALGVPQADSLPATADWAELSARQASDWRQLPGVGPVRARQLQAFFADHEVQRLGAQLAAAGVAGF